jgi:hypothetical protein
MCSSSSKHLSYQAPARSRFVTGRPIVMLVTFIRRAVGNAARRHNDVCGSVAAERSLLSSLRDCRTASAVCCYRELCRRNRGASDDLVHHLSQGTGGVDANSTQREVALLLGHSPGQDRLQLLGRAPKVVVAR